VAWSIESVRDANLSAVDVFRLYADPSTWGSWGHNTRWARADGPIVEGAIVHVKAGYGKVYPVRIRRLVVDRSIECEVRPAGLVVVNSYEVQPTPDGVRIRHRIEVSGRLARLLNLLFLDKLYTRLLSKETRRLVELAARRRDTLGHLTPQP
jgi:hypothetical protein